MTRAASASRMQGLVPKVAAALCLSLVLTSQSLAAVGDRRGFLAVSHPDGTRTVRAWIQIDARRTLFYAVSVDGRGGIMRVCSEPDPIPRDALTSPIGDIDTITTWTWNWLTAKGHGRLLVGFWDSQAGIDLASASMHGTPPPACP